MAHIRVRFDSDALIGDDETLDVDGSIEAYADALRVTLSDALPGHDIEVTDEMDLVSPVLVDILEAPDHDFEDGIRFEVWRLARRIWDDAGAWKMRLPEG